MFLSPLKRFVVVTLVVGTIAGCAAVEAKNSSPGSWVYPKARTVDVVDDYHGVKISDPYRWMEELDSPELKEWIEAENKLTFGYLAEIPAREAIRRRLTQVWDYERYYTPTKRGGRYFFSKNDGLQNHSVLYVADSLDSKPRVLLDPNKLSEDGTVALATKSVSDDGKLVAYGISSAGSDWMEFKVRDVDTGEDLPDHLKWIKFSGASWTKDGKGFFYTRYDEPGDPEKLESVHYFHKLYYHRLGTPQSDDKLIYHRPDEKEWIFRGRATDDGRYLIIIICKGSEKKSRVYYVDLQTGDNKVVKLLDDCDAVYNFIDNDGPIFWFLTDLDAPRRRVIAVDTRTPERNNWKEIIPETTDTLKNVSALNNMFVATYLKDAHSQVRIFDLKGKPIREIELPGIGSVYGFGGKRSDTETFYLFTSFAAPSTIYRYDLPTGRSTVFKKPKVDFNPDDYETKQVFYASTDGTRVPMFITHKKGLALDGNNPTFLYGYGGFSAPLTPRFQLNILVWMEMGGVYATANIRGGGEYGKQWHEAGRLANKQNSYEDFISAAKWLIANKYTRSEKLAICGASNGGLTMGACMTQRPDLFGAVVPQVGVFDMLRFHKFTIGWAWTADFGSPDDPEMFKVIRAYSPLHNIKPGTAYPSTLIMTADHDDRVVPSHSFKFAATLQAAQGGSEPILIRVSTRAGHGGGKPTAKKIEEITDRWAFLTRALNMDVAPFVSRVTGAASQ